MENEPVEDRAATSEPDPASFSWVHLIHNGTGLGSGLGWSGSEGHVTLTVPVFWYSVVVQFFHKSMVIASDDPHLRKVGTVVLSGRRRGSRLLKMSPGN